MGETDAGGRIGGRGRTYCLKSSRSGAQPTGAMALDKIDNINVSLAGGASRAQKLRAAVHAGKACVMKTRSRLSHCSAEATGARGIDMKKSRIRVGNGPAICGSIPSATAGAIALNRSARCSGVNSRSFAGYRICPSRRLDWSAKRGAQRPFFNDKRPVAGKRSLRATLRALVETTGKPYAITLLSLALRTGSSLDVRRVLRSQSCQRPPLGHRFCTV